MSRIKCGSCEVLIKKNEIESSIECNACRRKYHRNCTTLSSEEIKVFVSSSKLKWFCDLCNDDVSDMLSNYERFKKLSIAIEGMKKDMDDKVKNFEIRLSTLESTSSNKTVAEKVEEQFKRTTEKDKEEADLIKEKEQNLIYFNIPENGSDSVSERMKHEFMLLSEAYRNELKHDQISSIFRVGKKGENIRPLVVKFKSSETRNYVLRTSGKLSIKHQNEVKNIYVSIDRTQRQREAHKRLVDELKSRKLNGEENLVIRNNKIVQNFRKETAAEKVTFASLFRV